MSEKKEDFTAITKVLVTAKIIDKKIINKNYFITIQYYDIQNTFNNKHLYSKYDLKKFIKLYLVKKTDSNGKSIHYLELTSQS